MSVIKCRCPKCDAVLKLSAPPNGKTLKCPRCDTKFQPGQMDEAAAAQLDAAVAAVPKNGTTKPDTVVPAKSVTKRPSDKVKRATAAEDKGAPKPGGLSGTTLLLIGGGVLAVMLLFGGVAASVGAWIYFHRSEPTKDNTTTADATPPPDKQGKDQPQKPGDKNPPDRQDDKQPPEQRRVPDPKDDVVVEIPPLPPPDQRPYLVLDPGGHTAMVRQAFLSPDGRHVMTASFDKTIRIWEVLTGEPLGTFRLPVGPGAEGAINAIAVSPDGRRLAVGGNPFGGGKLGILVHIVSLETGRVETVLKGHKQAITSLAFSPDNRFLASSSFDGTVHVHATTDWKLAAELKGHTDNVNQVAWHKSSMRLATASHDNSVRLWDLRNPGTSKQLTGHTKYVNCLAWAPDGLSLASGSVDGTLRVWSEAGQPLATHQLKRGGHDTQLTSLTYLPDGKRVLFTGVDIATGAAGIFDLGTKKRVDFEKHTNTVLHGSLSPDGKLAVTTGGDDNETYVWKTDTLAVVQKLVGSGRAGWAVGWSADGKSIAWGNTNRGKTVEALTPLENTFHLDTLEITPGAPGNFLRARLNEEGYTVEVIDFGHLRVKGKDKTAELSLPNKNERIYSASVLPGDRIVVGGGQMLLLYDLKTMKPLREFKGHTGIVLGLTPSPDFKYFVTSSTDETLRIWSPDRDEPVLSIFVADTEWIAWTPEGYYAASPYGERLMGWQVNNGPDQLPSYYSAVQFRASLYQPDVIRALLPAGGLQNAVVQVVKERKQRISAVHLGQVLPPSVAITLPVSVPGGLTVNAGANVEVKATAQSSGNYPVTAMRLLLDGRPYLGRKGVRAIKDAKLGTAEAAWTVSIPSGKHVIAVQAESAVSKGVSTPLEVVAPESGELPSLYMVAIGVSAYPGKMKLNYAASDAELIAKTFREKTTGVFKKVDIHLVTDREATRDRIIKELEWLSSVMTAADVAVIYFSGHGARDDDGRFYLVPVDANPRSLERTFVSGDVLKQYLADMPGKVVALLDACHSGTVAEEIQTSQPDNLARDLVTEDYGVVVMCSSSGREYSIESSATRAGYFTFYLAEGLSGKADLNGDGIVYIHELHIYSTLKVRELSKGKQNPVTGRPPTIRSFPLSKVG
jgi:WD40 repeat protein